MPAVQGLASRLTAQKGYRQGHKRQGSDSRFVHVLRGADRRASPEGDDWQTGALAVKQGRSGRGQQWA